MFRLIFILIAGILGLSTLCIGAFQPKMHKTLFVYNSDYKIVETTTKVEPVKNLPTQVNPPVKQEVKKVVEKKVQAAPKTVQKVVEKPVVKVETQAPVKTVQVTTTQQTPNPLLSMIKETTPKVEPQVVVEEKVQAPQPVQKKEEVVAPVPVQTITEEEKARQEVILWNQWRSNLQNRIMTDVKLPIIPEGTIFRFSFDVDKYGKISNVQTWSLTPAYTPYAIQHIAPVIRSYQGREILKFPAGSNRLSTTVEGGWKISKTAKFSTPQDYKDSEKVIFKE